MPRRTGGGGGTGRRSWVARLRRRERRSWPWRRIARRRASRRQRGATRVRRTAEGRKGVSWPGRHQCACLVAVGENLAALEGIRVLLAYQTQERGRAVTEYQTGTLAQAGRARPRILLWIRASP